MLIAACNWYCVESAERQWRLHAGIQCPRPSSNLLHTGEQAPPVECAIVKGATLWSYAEKLVQGHCLPHA